METKKTEPVKVRGTATFYTSGDMGLLSFFHIILFCG